MSRVLEGRQVAIVGGASGIGRATAEAMAAEGAAITIGDVNDDAGQKLAKRLGRAAHFLHCDVTSEKSVSGFFAGLAEQAGNLDVLVNCAGVLLHRSFVDVTAADWDRVFSVNSRSTFLCCREAIPLMRKSDGGSIINMSSMAGLRGAPGLTVYAASKAAMIGLSTALALELAPEKIRVNAICPGWIDTPFNQPFVDSLGGPEGQTRAIAKDIPVKRMGTPQEVAALAVYLASDAAAFVTAQAISINGGAYN